MATAKSFWPARWWWMVLFVILVCAGGLRYTGYNFSLPYVDHVDEPAYNLAGRMMIDFGSAKPLGMQGYPPGIVTLNYVLLRWFQDPAEPPAALIGPLRLISITFSLGTVLLIALLGYRVAAPMAGLLAAGLWTVTPLAVEHSRYATADNFVTFFTLLSFFLMLSGTLYDRDKWITYSMVAIIVAILFKYQAIFVLPLIVAGPLWRLVYLRDKAQTRRILKNLVNNLAILGVFLIWLILIFPALDATSAPDWSAPTARLGLPTWDMLRVNLDRTRTPLWNRAVWLPGVLGLGMLLWPRLRRQAYPFGLAVLIAGGAMWGFGVSLYGYQFFRQFIALGALMTILCGTGLSAWWMVLDQGLKLLRQPAVFLNRRPWASALVPAALVLILNWSNLDASIANAREHTLPDRRNDLGSYADTSLAPGSYIGSSENHKTFNRDWGGYTGQNSFPLYAMAHVMDRPIREWRATGVTYAIIPYYEYEQMQASPEGHTTLDQMLLLKSYPPSKEFRGPDMVVLRFFPIQHPADGSLGPVRLVGYDIDHTRVQPSGTITFTLYWQATEALPSEYVVYNHLAPLSSRDIIGQIDGPPLPDVRRSTQDWDDPNETLVSRPFTLAVGADVPPGEYRMITGFYRRDTGERLIGPGGDDYVTVTTITVLGHK